LYALNTQGSLSDIAIFKSNDFDVAQYFSVEKFSYVYLFISTQLDVLPL